MRIGTSIAAGLLAVLFLFGCEGAPAASGSGALSEPFAGKEDTVMTASQSSVSAFPTEATPYTRQSSIAQVMADPTFGDWSRLIFPADTGYWSGDTLEDLRLTWYSHIDPDKTVEIINYMKAHADTGETIFYDIYTEEEKVADPAKRDTGLFFFRGGSGGEVCRLQRRWGLRLCRGDARQLPPRLRAVQKGLQRLRPHLPSRGADRLRGSGPCHQLYLCPRGGVTGGYR